MHCPFCSANDTKVIDSRLVSGGGQVRRRRECLSCSERFTTFEIAELVLPRVVKQDETSEPFDERKLRSGFQRALEKRPVSQEAIEAAIDHIKSVLRATGEREVPSRIIGEAVMTELRPGTAESRHAVIKRMQCLKSMQLCILQNKQPCAPAC